MKLDASNARFAVVGTAFHNGGTYSFHNSYDAAIKAKKQHQSETCTCGCAGVVPVTEDALREMIATGDYYDRPALYTDLPDWEPGKQTPYQLCK